MLFWFIAIAVTAIACAALFYAAGPRPVNAGQVESDDANSHFRLLLSGIDADLAAGKLGEAEATAAKAELAREILRTNAQRGQARPSEEFSRAALLSGLIAIAGVALGLYAVLGSPDLPGQPLAARAEASGQPIDLDSAVARIETALAASPDDLRGWTVIAPAYMELGRFEDAVAAYRRIVELAGATPGLQIKLAEALIFAAGGEGSPEAMELLRAVAAANPDDALSRLYIASELMRQGQYGDAAMAWREAIALAKGDEPWLAAARQGLAAAGNNGVVPQNEQEGEMIGQMVSGLVSRLAEQGGSIEEWTQLVRAYLVLGDLASAQQTLDSAVTAYPQTFDRGELDALALGAGLTIKGATP